MKKPPLPIYTYSNPREHQEWSVLPWDVSPLIEKALQELTSISWSLLDLEGPHNQAVQNSDYEDVRKLHSEGPYIHENKIHSKSHNEKKRRMQYTFDQLVMNPTMRIHKVVGFTTWCSQIFNRKPWQQWVEDRKYIKHKRGMHKML